MKTALSFCCLAPKVWAVFSVLFSGEEGDPFGVGFCDKDLPVFSGKGHRTAGGGFLFREKSEHRRPASGHAGGEGTVFEELLPERFYRFVLL